MSSFKKYCISLKAGSLLIGYFFLAVYVAIFVLSLYANIRGIPIFKNYIFIIILCVDILMLIFTALLVYGIYKKKSNFMLPWLIIKFLAVVIGSIVTVILCGSTIVAAFMHENYLLLIIFFLVPVILCICWCVYYVVYSHYKQLTDENVSNASHVVSKDDLKTSIMTRE